jgi:nitronate monooxygenase
MRVGFQRFGRRFACAPTTGHTSAALSASSLHTELPYSTGVFKIGLVDWVIRKEPGLFDAARTVRPVLISVSFGTELSWVGRVHDAGIAAAP